MRERRLARALRHLREETDLTIEDVADKLEISASTISRMETAQVGVRPRDLRFLLDMYEVSEAERVQLLQIARERRQQHWWQEYADLPNIAVAASRRTPPPSRSTRPNRPRAAPDRGLRPCRARGHPLDARAYDIDRRLELRIHWHAVLTGEHAPGY